MARNRCTHNVVATVGEYKDPQTGETKKRRTRVGVAFTDEDGNISLKMETVPVGNSWSGWLNLFERDDNRTSAGNSGGSHQAPDESEDEIPF